MARRVRSKRKVASPGDRRTPRLVRKRRDSPSVLTVAASDTERPFTIVYVHGIGNKPAPAVLKCQWDMALFGVELGEASRMAYWVNREYYPQPLPETSGAGDVVPLREEMAGLEAAGIQAARLGAAAAGKELIERDIAALTAKESERKVLRGLAARLAMQEATGSRAHKASAPRAKVLPVPPFLRRWITWGVSRALLRDVNDFLFHEDRRERMEQTLRGRLTFGGGPYVVIAHSQGSMIAWNVLRQMPNCDVRLFVTIGSPLGLDEVQDVLRRWVGSKTLPVPSCVPRWVNVAEWLDPVAADHDLTNDFAPGSRIENYDGLLLNPDAPNSPHSATGYLRTTHVRGAVREAVGTGLGQAVRPFVIARDLVGDLENAPDEARHDVLLQLVAPDTGETDRPSLAVREAVIAEIRRLAGPRAAEAAIEPLRRFVGARLTRSEVEHLQARFKTLRIDKIWRDAAKRALINASAHTIQATPANLGYSATGRDIRWAVLDTGICADHPHFQEASNVEAIWDCTRAGLPVRGQAADAIGRDGAGHGTHVAAIIAGRYRVPLKRGEPPALLAGMAPEAKLHVYKVLDDHGNGRDSWIIKALDHIAAVNEAAADLVIHGVNLSLGGSFDPNVFGCGHSPLCQELRRLWRQGVLICTAAGNEGYAVLQSEEGPVEANMDLSIGDPANLDEAIAVGSVHKLRPHTYGISYFSSRGPTADGRIKPDVVAPGERILSAAHRFRVKAEAVASDLYVEMSGTSMATPHVSGVLAAFLSVRREFISFPDRVKQILLANATDLGRNRYFQGAGLPNLIKMLANT